MTIVDAKVPWDREARLAQDGLAFPRDEYEARIEKVRLGMQEADLSHLIAYGNYADPGNITYLSGFFTRHGDSFVVVPLEGEPTLLTNWVMHDEPMHSEIWTTWLGRRPALPAVHLRRRRRAGRRRQSRRRCRPHRVRRHAGSGPPRSCARSSPASTSSWHPPTG